MINIKNIGIIIRNFKENNKKYIGVREDIFNKFYNYDVNIIGIPIDNDFNKIKNIVDLCDGIVLSGGDNFVVQDFLLVNYLYKKNIPTLGICLGMQSMARCFSNKEEINVSDHLDNSEYVHYININKGSLLKKIFKKSKLLVNSRHKSAIIHTDLLVSAKSADGLIEAVEAPNKKFFVGVQWHPESLNDIDTIKLFDYFVNIVKENKKT